MKVFVATFSENIGWGTRFDNEYRPVAVEVFASKSSAVEWGRGMKKKSRYHSSVCIVEKLVN